MPIYAFALLALIFLVGTLSARRIGLVIELRPEKEQIYRELHADTWQSVLDRISASNLRRYSIFLTEIDPGRPLLFGVYDYIGDDLEQDMAAIAADPATQAWWKETDPCQKPVPTAGEGVWWKTMEEVFYTSGEPSEGSSEA